MKVTKILNLIFTCVAIFALVVSFTLLFIRGTTVYEEEMWGVHTSTYKRVDLDSEYTYGSHNFFERMRKLNYEGFGTGIQVFIIILFVVSLALMVVSIFVKFFKNIYFAAPPTLLNAILCIVLAGDNGTGYVLDSEMLGILYNHRIWTQDTVEFNLVLTPTIILLFFVFALTLAAGILYMVGKRAEARLAAETAAAEAAAMGTMAPEGVVMAETTTTEEMVAPTEAPVETPVQEQSPEMDEGLSSTLETLKQYQQMLEQGVITEEEYEAKRKQLLGL